MIKATHFWNRRTCWSRRNFRQNHGSVTHFFFTVSAVLCSEYYLFQHLYKQFQYRLQHWMTPTLVTGMPSSPLPLPPSTHFPLSLLWSFPLYSWKRGQFFLQLIYYASFWRSWTYWLFFVPRLYRDHLHVTICVSYVRLFSTDKQTWGLRLAVVFTMSCKSIIRPLKDWSAQLK